MQTKNNSNIGDKIIKVNHAGEHGAVCIYSGQIFMARFTAAHLLQELHHFRADELKHRQIFADELKRRGQAHCKSYWLCALGGLVLGLMTGLFGTRAIAATTVAVERVVLRHLEQQISLLVLIDREATQAISCIVEEEKNHHDQSTLHLKTSRFWTRLLMIVVDRATELVIFLGMKL